MHMKEIRFVSHSVLQTIEVARKLSHLLKKGDVIGLVGNLGSGKTTFIQGLAQGLGVRHTINSPSFVILKIYPQKTPLHHFDLYRLRSLKDLEDIGYEDFICDSGISVIEWADRAGQLLPKEYLKVTIEIKGKTARAIRFTGYGLRYQRLVRVFSAAFIAKKSSIGSRKSRKR